MRQRLWQNRQEQQISEENIFSWKKEKHLSSLEGYVFFYLVMIFLNLIWSQIWSLPGWSDSRDHLSFQHASPWRPTLEYIGVCLYLCCLDSGTNMWMEESSLDASRILPDRETPTLVKLQNVKCQKIHVRDVDKTRIQGEKRFAKSRNRPWIWRGRLVLAKLLVASDVPKSHLEWPITFFLAAIQLFERLYILWTYRYITWWWEKVLAYTVLSSLQVAKVSPDGWKATELTSEVWPHNIWVQPGILERNMV